MERIIYRKTLDLHKSGVQFTLQGFQTADNMARTLELSLMASGETIDLPLEQLIAVMYVTTPNATEPSINECTIKDNTIICDVLPIVEEGITEMQLKLIETSPDGANGVLATPEFAIEVSKSNTNDESATQKTTFTALETALAKAKGVYDARLLRIELDSDCMFRAYYADGAVYESDVLKELFLKGDALLSQSYARGGTGVRAGEDTDNSMYYSNASKSSAIEANASREETLDLLEEVRKHGVYTAFSIDFETGEVEYVSPSYNFIIDKESGELKAIGETYSFEETIQAIVTEWLNENGANIKALQETSTKHTEDIAANKTNIEALEETTHTLQNETIPALETRIGESETALDSLNEDYSSNKAETLQRFATNEENIEGLEDALHTTNISLETAHSNHTTLADTVAKQGSQINILNQAVKNVQQENSGTIYAFEDDFSYNGTLSSVMGTLSWFQCYSYSRVYGQIEMNLSDNFAVGEDNVFYLKKESDGYFYATPAPDVKLWFSVPCQLYYGSDIVYSSGICAASISPAGELIIHLNDISGITKIVANIDVSYGFPSKG